MTGEQNTASRDLPRWLPHSLRRQILLGVLAVVSVVLVSVGIVSVLSLRGYVTAMSDADVAQSLDALSNSYSRYRNGDQGPARRGGQPIGQAMLEFTDQTPGNVIAVLRGGVVIGSAVFSEAEARPAPADVVRALEGQSAWGPTGSTAASTDPTSWSSGYRWPAPTTSSSANSSPPQRLSRPRSR
jgi:two-component system sensor histidine kinase TrcS